MLRDLLTRGVIIGFLSDVVKLVANYIMYQLGFTNVVFWQIVATRFLEKKDLFKPSALFIGAVADVIVSAALGVLFVFFIYNFGSKFLYLKGIGYGLFIWVSIFGTLLGQSVQAKLPQTSAGIIVTIVAHFVFGLSMAVFTGWLSKYPLDEKNTETAITKNRITMSFIPSAGPLKKTINNSTQFKKNTTKPKRLKFKRQSN